MRLHSLSEIAFSFFLLSITATASDTAPLGYQKGTITQQFSPSHKSYVLKTGDNGYQINNCGDFQNAQVVDYRVKEDKIYIRRDDGKESKCAIEATLGIAPVAPPIVYQKGTIGGYEVRRDTHIGGGGGAPGAPSSPVSAWTRHAKVYELHGPDLTYKVDYCGAFQAGQFSPGQVVEFRVDSDRLYIRHDNDKEYSCQLEGTVKADAKPAEAAPQPSATPSSAAAPTAKLSIASVPEGADIEVDGSFSGNTPSDLEVPEGERTITVKKSGYKDWQRKMKVVAGSNIHLNAEMEKAN